MITLYLDSNGSSMHSRKSMPSVKYLILVRVGLETSSNRIVYPTCAHPRSQNMSKVVRTFLD